MRIAIVGAGISGLVTAYLLNEDHEISIFEADGRIGGHTHTVMVPEGDGTVAVDTGFVVFNDRNYPSFGLLLDRLGVESQSSEMSFSVRSERSGLEYSGDSLSALFASRLNLLRPAFYRMVGEVFRFSRDAARLRERLAAEVSLREFLADRSYSREFIDSLIVPMGSALWSADPRGIGAFPARHFLNFFHQHGLLSLRDHPDWKVIKGGSARYVERLVAPFRDRIRVRTPVRSVRRHPDRVEIGLASGECERFDLAVLATHADQSLSMLANPSDAEREILGAVPYQENRTMLHTDTALLPRRRPAWASWNYTIPRQEKRRVAITYLMNRLQSLDSPTQYCVTLNREDEIDPDQVIERITYHHPVYTSATFAAQERHQELNGTNRTYFCGAYWGYGFHEDGVRSALEVARHFGKAL